MNVRILSINEIDVLGAKRAESAHESKHSFAQSPCELDLSHADEEFALDKIRSEFLEDLAVLFFHESVCNFDGLRLDAVTLVSDSKTTCIVENIGENVNWIANHVSAVV